jgi:hypothetical protein
MGMKIPDERIEELLARGRLGGPIRERVLERALRDANIVRSRWYARSPFVWTLPALGTAAVAMFAVMLRPLPDAMRAKGGAGAGPVVSVECNGADPSRCAQDDTLLFRIEGAAGQAYLAAYADPDTGGERIWFFPLADGTSPVILAQQEPQVLHQGVKVRSLPSGRYQIHAVLSRRPLSKLEALSVPDGELVAARNLAIEVQP